MYQTMTLTENLYDGYDPLNIDSHEIQTRIDEILSKTVCFLCSRPGWTVMIYVGYYNGEIKS